jgi:predicted nucleic acid-binding protein
MVIAFLKGEADRVAACRAALHDGEAGTTRPLTSAFTLAEVVRHGQRRLNGQALAMIDGFFNQPWIRVVALDRNVSTEARRISWEYGLKPPDAVHIATAVFYGAKALFTYDDQILELDGAVPNLSIGEPAGQLLLIT